MPFWKRPLVEAANKMAGGGGDNSDGDGHDWNEFGMLSGKNKMKVLQIK